MKKKKFLFVTIIAAIILIVLMIINQAILKQISSEDAQSGQGILAGPMTLKQRQGVVNVGGGNYSTGDGVANWQPGQTPELKTTEELPPAPASVILIQ